MLSPTLPIGIHCTWEACSKLQEISTLVFFPLIPQKPYLSLICSMSDSPNSASFSLYDCSQFFLSVVFSPYLELISDPSFMAPRSLTFWLHQKLWFAPSSTAAIERPIISYSAGRYLHWHFLKIAVTSKALHFLFLFYSLFTSPAFAVT